MMATIAVVDEPPRIIYVAYDFPTHSVEFQIFLGKILGVISATFTLSDLLTIKDEYEEEFLNTHSMFSRALCVSGPLDYGEITSRTKRTVVEFSWTVIKEYLSGCFCFIHVQIPTLVNEALQFLGIPTIHTRWQDCISVLIIQCLLLHSDNAKHALLGSVRFMDQMNRSDIELYLLIIKELLIVAGLGHDSAVDKFISVLCDAIPGITVPVIPIAWRLSALVHDRTPISELRAIIALYLVMQRPL